MSLSSTHAEIHVTFAGTTAAVYFFYMAGFLDMPDANQPIRIYQDSQPCIDILTSGVVSKCVKHIAMPVHYVYTGIVKDITNMEHIQTSLQAADLGGKTQYWPLYCSVHMTMQTEYASTPHRFLSMLKLSASLPTTPPIPSPFLLHDLVTLPLFN